LKKLVTPFKVGLLVLISGVAFIAFFTFTKKSKLNESNALTVFALFHDASGLGEKSRVQVAGIQVGEIAEIRLEGTRARVTLRIRNDVPMHVDAGIAKRSESMLGDFLLDLTPGSDTVPLMPEGGEIKKVLDRTGMDQTFDKLNIIAADIQEVTTSLRSVLGGEKGAGNLQSIMENMVQLSASMEKTIVDSGEKLNAVLRNLETASGAVSSLTHSEEDNFRQIVTNVRGASQDVRDVLATVKQVLGSGEGGFNQSVAGIKQSLAKLDEAMAHIESVTGKIDKGEGTLGALVNDKAIGENLGNAVADASDMVSKMATLMTEVTLREEYHWFQKSGKTYLQLKIIPKPDKYYLFEVIDDPRGLTIEQTVQRLPPDSTQRELQTTITTTEQLKFSAEFAKRFYFVTLRFGIIENTGGVGANLHFFDDHLTITVDLFEFASQYKDYPRLKASLNYAFLGHLYITAGADDILNKTLYDTDVVSAAAADISKRRVISGRDFFFGAGIYFTDEDLKSIIGSVPLPK